MKVLHLFPEFRRGGAPVNTLRFIKATSGELEHIAVGQAADRELFDEYLPHAKAWDIDLTRPSVQSFIKLYHLARRESPDIVHANGKAGTVYGLFLSLLLPRRTRFFLTLRGFHDKFSGFKSTFYRFLEHVMARRVVAVICVSPSERRHYLELIKADEKKAILVPNGIDVTEQPLPDDIAAVTAEYAVNIVTLSRLSPQKDLGVMIRSFAKASEGRDSIALHIIGGLSHGEEEYRTGVETLHADSPAKKRIYFWGDRKAAGNLLKHFDIYFTTARFEGLPTAVVEAFLSRIPVVGTDCIGNIDLIRCGETGWLASVGDVDNLSEALSMAIESHQNEDTKKIVERAYNDAGAYSVERQAERLLTLYREN